jgi:hypothetical protein
MEMEMVTVRVRTLLHVRDPVPPHHDPPTTNMSGTIIVNVRPTKTPEVPDLEVTLQKTDLDPPQETMSVLPATEMDILVAAGESWNLITTTSDGVTSCWSQR